MSTQVRFDFRALAARTALLVVDMQRMFLEPASPLCIPGGLALIPRLNSLAAHCRRLKVPVLYSATVYRKDGLDLGLATQALPPWTDLAPLLVDPEWQALHAELQRQESDPFFAKTRYSVFYKTGLGEWLSKHGRDTLIIGGVASAVCCASTARDAYFRDLRPIVLADCSATYGIADMGYGAFSADQMHRMMLTDLARHCARVARSEAVVAELGQSSLSIKEG
ncbi:MAG TPA: isochorismatase family cysteine hydrolase [Burkholderiales bacterium]|jgi:ureidoacrylate peracid hydrolase|nr:isochorismatase family cysteine hydrolase [Burkholderiales bacterium]